MHTPAQIEKITRPTQPRVPPVDPATMTDEQRAIAGIGASAVIQTLVRRDDLMTPWLALGTTLVFNGRLRGRDRELVILRVALRTTCDYEWANHVPGALGYGATEQEILAVTDESASWSASDAALLAAVDELCGDDCLSDDTWAALRTHLDEGEIIELLFVIGYYRMTAGILNSLGVQPEPGRAHLGTLPEPAAAAGPPHQPATPQQTGTTGPPDGTWNITFHHPAGDQQLTVTFASSDGQISGSLTNSKLGITTQITNGTINGNHIAYTTVVTEPVHTTINWDGTVTADTITGQATVSGAPPFPFTGTRAAE